MTIDLSSGQPPVNNLMTIRGRTSRMGQHRHSSAARLSDLVQAARVRDQACELLDQLQDDRHRLEASLVDSGRPDRIKEVTGLSSLDQAIQSTRRVIDAMDRLLSDSEDGADANTLQRALGLTAGMARREAMPVEV